MARDHFGIYQAKVLSVSNGRIQLMVPSADIPTTGWAQVCLAPGASISSVKAGDTGWVMYQAGDPSYPVFMGICPG